MADLAREHERARVSQMRLRLQRRIRQLEAENDDLRIRIAAVEARIAELLAELEQVKRDAVHDDLTGLFRRAFFLLEVGRFITLLPGDKRSGVLSSASVIFLDIDFFKEINDKFGHKVGDVVLRAVADALKGALRQGDLSCRWGGDEAVAFLPGATAVIARRKADALLERIRGIRFDEYPSLRVTASIGVAIVTAENPASADSLICRADGAMYRAKEGGRNCVVLAS